MATILIALLAIVVLIALGIGVVGAAANILWMVLIGLVVGAVARFVVPGEQNMGWLSTALLGVVGGLVGGLIANAADLGGILQFVISVACAAVLVALFAGTTSDRRVSD